jgi:hypothetical protein
VGLVVGLPALFLTNRLAGDGPLLGMPLWGTALLMLPGIAYLVAERRAKRPKES